MKLRADALRQREVDGGTLSPESTATLQARLDQINRRFAKAMRNNNPLTVDSTGRKTAVAPAQAWNDTDLFMTGKQ